MLLSSQWVLTVRRFRTTSAHCDDRRHCVQQRASRTCPPAAPVWRLGCSCILFQPAIEPTCYAALALGSTPVGDIERAQDFLLRTQNPNGSWPVVPGDDQEGGWVTSLAVIVLRDLVPAIPARLQGFHWLLDCSGRESNWLWKWKFRTADRHVRFDPDKYGWPWFSDTVSWAVPTAFAILALNQIPCSCGDLERIRLRVDCGIQMLFDRACPGGGWNGGMVLSMSAPWRRTSTIRRLLFWH